MDRALIRPSGTFSHFDAAKREKANISAFSRAHLGMREGADRRMRATAQTPSSIP